jgi:DNA-binding NtrC family response regulator
VADVFRQYRWPGNVRELENLLERIFILEDENTIMVKHLPARILRDVRDGRTVQQTSEGATPPPGGGPVDYYQTTAAFQVRLIREALTAANGSLTEAGLRLGLSRHALRHQMLKLGMA